MGGAADMRRRSLLAALLVLIATTSLAAPPPVNPEDATAFMNHLWDRAVELLDNKTDPAVRQAIVARERRLIRHVYTRKDVES